MAASGNDADLTFVILPDPTGADKTPLKEYKDRFLAEWNKVRAGVPCADRCLHARPVLTRPGLHAMLFLSSATASRTA